MAIARPMSKRQKYINEMQDFVKARFPDAQFRLTPMPDVRGATAIWTYTSADALDVIDYTAGLTDELLVDQDVFLCVIPLPPRENGDA